MISCKQECVVIRNLSNLTLPIIFNAWWASMDVGSRGPIAWNNSRHAPSWCFYLHSGIEETGSPVIICIVCHQVLRHPSEHGTSSMGKHLLAKAHFAKLNKLTESEVSKLTSTTIDETALTILKWQGICGISMVRLQKKFIVDNSILPLLTQLTDRTLQTGSKGLPNCQISPRYLESLPQVRSCFGTHSMEWYIKPQAVTVINASRGELMLPSASTLSNICRREYSLTVDAIKKQLPSRNDVCLACDGWTSTNILAETLGIAYYMDRNWVFREVQLALDKVDNLFSSYFEC